MPALTRIDEFNDYFGTRFSDEEFDTIGGLVLHELGRMPRRGEAVEIGGLEFRVLRADRRRIETLRVDDAARHSTLAPASRPESRPRCRRIASAAAPGALARAARGRRAAPLAFAPASLCAARACSCPAVAVPAVGGRHAARAPPGAASCSRAALFLAGTYWLYNSIHLVGRRRCGSRCS